MVSGPTVALTARIPQVLQERLDRLALGMTAAAPPTVEVTRSDALRAVMEAGLAALEPRYPAPAPPPPAAPAKPSRKAPKRAR